MLFQTDDINDVKNEVKIKKELFVQRCEEMKNAYFVSKTENLEVLKKECRKQKEILKEHKLKYKRELELQVKNNI